jgi:hypothetical protein
VPAGIGRHDQLGAWSRRVRRRHTGAHGGTGLAAAELVEGLLIFAVVSLRPGTESRLSRLEWSLLTAVGVNTVSLLIDLIMMPAMINQ